jgi:hypothetical protein
MWTFTPADVNWFGSDSFTVTITDDLGGTTNQIVNITLANFDDAAVITGDISYNGNEGDAVGGDMDATDVEGLTDGTYFTVSAQGANGTAAIDPATGVWSFTPADSNWFGSDNFTVTITDDLGGTTNQIVNIILANVDDAAVITGDISYNGNEGDAVVGDMNATDVEGLTDGDYFAVTLQTANGMAAIDPATGAWTFTPTDTNWFGTDSFTVTVTDDLGGTTTQVVNITLANADDDAAVITGDVSYTGNEGDAVGGDIDASDPEGLTDGTYFTVTTPAANGTAVIDPATGSWTFTPTDPNWIGTDNFTVTVTDDLGGTTTQVVNITLANVDDDPAAISGDVSYTGNEGDAVGGDIDAADPEGLTDGTYFTVTTPAANGTAVIDPATGVWIFTPTDPNWIGTDNFTVTVTDDLGGTTTQVVNITLANVDDDPTVISGDVNYTGNEGDAVGGDIDATDPEGLSGGNFTVTTDPANGTATIDPDTGVWIFIPTDPDWSGTDSFTVTVTDDLGGTTTQVINITLADAPANPGGGGTDPGGNPDPIVPEPDPELPPEEILPPFKEVSPPTGDPGISILGPSTTSSPNHNVSTVSLDLSDSAMPGDKSLPSDMADVLRDLMRGPGSHETAQEGPNTGFFSAEALTQTLDRIQQQIDLSMASDAKQGNMIIGMATGLGMSVFAGYVIWALRGTSLLVGALTAMPMWRCFDPLPVLLGNDRDKKKKKRLELEDDEDKVKNLLGGGQVDSNKQDPRRKPN